MSGLAALLAGRVPTGTYRWHGGFDVADVRHTVEHAGWAFVPLDGVRIESKEEFLEAAGAALELPEHAKDSFDALGDLLQDLDPDKGTVVLWDSWGPFARADENAFKVALTVLGTRVNAERKAPFAVLLRGDGPEPSGVSSLD